jgi:hypothetical protein
MRKEMAALVVLLAGSAFAQFTTVSGTVIDPNGLPYSNGTINATLIFSGGTPMLNGVPYQPPTQATLLDLSGSFKLQLADTSLLSPAGSKWLFTLCSSAGSVQPAFGKGSVCASTAGLTISGVSQNISTQLNAVALPLTVNFGSMALNPTSGTMPIRSGTSLADSPFSVASGVATYAGSGGVAGQISLGQGTVAAAVSGQVGISAPSSVTAYQFLLPGASGTGFLFDSATANLDTISRVATTGSGNVVLASGPSIQNATCTGTCTGFGGSTASITSIFLHSACFGAVFISSSGGGGVSLPGLGGNPGNSCNGIFQNDATLGTLLTHPCVLQRLFINSRTSGGAVGDGIVTVRDGATSTSITCTIGTGSSCNDTTHTFSAVTGDLIWIFVATTTTNLSNVSVGLECD